MCIIFIYIYMCVAYWWRTQPTALNSIAHPHNVAYVELWMYQGDRFTEWRVEIKRFSGLDWRRMHTHVSLYYTSPHIFYIHLATILFLHRTTGVFASVYTMLGHSETPRPTVFAFVGIRFGIDKCSMHWNDVIPGGNWWRSMAAVYGVSWKHKAKNHLVRFNHFKLLCIYSDLPRSIRRLHHQTLFTALSVSISLIA